MNADMIATVLVRDLKTLKRELEAFKDERHIWRTAPGITNSAGSLTLHMTGNLRHFIGAQLGKTGYARNRDAEFARRDVPRADLLKEADEAIIAVERTVPKLSDKDLAKPFPIPVGGVTLETGDFLMHLATHLTYHLGQLDYLRRFSTGEVGKIGALAPTELKTAKKVS
ncbi:MAG: DinB family protein [Gemmatimonadales bacterium]